MMLNNKRVQTDSEELLGLRGVRDNRAVRFRDLKGEEVVTAVTKVVDSGVGKETKKKLDEVSGLVDEALNAAGQAADDAQNANTAAQGAHDFADREVQKALRNLGGVYEVMEAGFALSSEAQGRDRVCLNDTFLVSSDWVRYGSQGVMTDLENAAFPIGRTKRFVVTPEQEDGLMITESPATIWTGPKDANAFVIEVTLTTGNLAGAGVRLTWNNSTGASFATAIQFVDMEVTPFVAGKSRVARAVFQKPAAFTGTFASHTLHVFANWTPWPRAQKTIQFHRVNVRLASAEEAETGKVSASVKAFLNEHYMTAAKTDLAIANYDMTLQASLVDTVATVQRTSTAIASLNGSVARFRDVVSINGQNAAGIEAVSFSGTGDGTGSVLKLIGDDVIAEGTLSAANLVVHDGSGNLFPDPQFSHKLLTGWTVTGAGVVRPQPSSELAAGTIKDAAPAQTMLYFNNHAGQGAVTLNGPYIPAEAGDVFNIGFTAAVRGGGTHVLVLRLAFFNNAGGVISAPELTMTTAPEEWQRFSADVTAPTGTARARIQIFSRDPGMNNWAVMTNCSVIRKRTGATLITPNSITSELFNAVDLNVAGLAIFGGALRSDNFDAASGTGWQITKSGGLTVPNASITNAKIGNVIQSNNYVPNGAGWSINKNGAAEFDNVKIRRQLEMSSGTVNVGSFTPETQWTVDPTAGPKATGNAVNIENGPGKVVTVLIGTGIPITEWMGVKKTYLANAGMTGTVNSPSTSTCYWGWTADVLPLTKWDGNQTLRLRLSFWCQSVTLVQNCVVTWKVYEVS